MNRTIRFNKDLFDKLIEIQKMFNDKHHLDLSLNFIINHLIKEGLQHAPLLLSNSLLTKQQ